jgi:uncharacterized protein YvpB
MEAFRLSVAGSVPGGVEYSAHVQDIGWTGWAADGAVAGAEGQNKRVEAVRIRLTGEMANRFDVYYRAHVQNLGWMGWAKNGASAGTRSVGYAMEAFEIVVMIKGAPAPGSTSGAYRDTVPNQIPGGFILNVPTVAQRPELPTGCEITAVTMMLKYKGANVSKVQLAREMPYHSSNPNYGYVGNPFLSSGWTIYPSALTGLVSRHAGSSVNMTGRGIGAIEASIRGNRPVVVWMTMHGFGVHAVTVTGYNSTHIFFNDPWTGQKNASLTRAAFLSSWKSQSYRAISY